MKKALFVMGAAVMFTSAVFVILATSTVRAQTSTCYTFTRTLRTGVVLTSTEAAALQRELASEGFWDVSIPIVAYDDAVAGAVTQLQEANAPTVLTPSGLAAGTGILGPASRTFLNRKYGCPYVPTAPSITPNPPIISAAPICAAGSNCNDVVQPSIIACPIGYVCTPRIVTAPTGCPPGYVCSPIGSTVTINPGSGSGGYVPPSSNNPNYNSPTYPGYTSYLPTDYSSYFAGTGSNSGSNTSGGAYPGATYPAGSASNGGSSNTPGAVSPAAAVGGAVGDTTISAAITQDTTTNDPPVGTNLPAYEGVITTAPISTPLPFTVDYSRSLSASLAAAGIGMDKVDDNIMLGLYPFGGSGTKNLTLRVVTAKDLFPAMFTTNSSVVSNTQTANEIFAIMKGRGYRPVNLQELLAFKATYPQYFGKAGAVGSEVHFGTPVQLSQNWVNSCPFNAVPSSMKAYCYVKSPGNTYYYAIPQVTTNSVNLLPVISLDSYNPINADSLKAKSWKTTMSAGDKFYVIEDAASAATTVAEVQSAPTSSRSGPYTVLTTESYPVNVNYDKAYPKSTKNVNNTVNASQSGQHTITVNFALIHGTQWTTDDAAKALVNSIPGYRPATAQELLAMNEQYPNKFDGVMGFGSVNPDCGGFPVLYKRDWTEYVGTPNLPPGVTNPKGATGYLDKTIVDINACIQVLPDGWFDTAPKDAKGGVQALNIIAAGNSALRSDPIYATSGLAGKDCSSTRRNTNFWKYAIVKI